MDQQVGFSSFFVANVEAEHQEVFNVEVGGEFKFEAFESKEAMERGDPPLWTETVKNGVTTNGLDNVLNVYFGASAQRTTWFIGLIASGAVLNAADTMLSHAGWTEIIAYSEANRQTWALGASSGNSVTNATPAAFTINTNGTVIAGAFLTSDNAKNGTAGQLWATGLFASAQTLNIGNILRVTYTCTSTGS